MPRQQRQQQLGQRHQHGEQRSPITPAVQPNARAQRCSRRCHNAFTRGDSDRSAADRDADLQQDDIKLFLRIMLFGLKAYAFGDELFQFGHRTGLFFEDTVHHRGLAITSSFSALNWRTARVISRKIS